MALDLNTTNAYNWPAVDVVNNLQFLIISGSSVVGYCSSEATLLKIVQESTIGVL